jgi:hypothetical protein
VQGRLNAMESYRMMNLLAKFPQTLAAPEPCSLQGTGTITISSGVGCSHAIAHCANVTLGVQQMKSRQGAH